MNQKISMPSTEDIPLFDRNFFNSENVVSRIGGGAIGGKASGLAFAQRVLGDCFPDHVFEGIEVSVPRLVVLGTDIFDAFMSRNDLYETALDDMADDRIANAFQRAEFPAEFAGDLRSLIGSVHTPLAIRSSSMLEDAMYEPFAGVYETKMTPNNQPDTDTRYKKLVEGIKFVYASTFFREAKAYGSMTGHTISEEKMAVIIQEVVGHRFDDRFYPSISGVGRSFNFYSFGHAQPEDGVVDLALGLGKAIVDGGLVWTYCPEYPNANPPFTTADLLKNTQTEFWAVNMGKPQAYDPIHEKEYLVQCPLKEAESDGSLALVASTYQPQNDRIVMGIGADGPRVLNFAPVIRLSDIPLNDLVKKLLTACSDGLGAAIEIEFAAVLDTHKESPPRFGLLQVRAMVVSDEQVEVTDSDLKSERVLLASEHVLGNGTNTDLTDIVYVKPEGFLKENTRAIASEINTINRDIVADGKHYVLIGFGRWGSSDPWLGIPVDWGNISGAKVIVEATLPDMNVELSQGSHFFHNITSLQIPYFCVRFDSGFEIDWAWLDQQQIISETEFVRHVWVTSPLVVQLDGRSRRGVIQR